MNKKELLVRVALVGTTLGMGALEGCSNLPDNLPISIPGRETPTAVARSNPTQVPFEVLEAQSIKSRLLEVGFPTDPQVMQAVNNLRPQDITASANGLYTVNLRNPRPIEFDLAVGNWEGTNTPKIIFRGYTDQAGHFGDKDTKVQYTGQEEVDFQNKYKDPQSGVWPRAELSKRYRDMFGMDPRLIYEDNGRDQNLRNLPRFPDEQWKPDVYPGSLIADGLSQRTDGSSVRYLRHWDGEVIAVITDQLRNPQAAAALRKLLT